MATRLWVTLAGGMMVTGCATHTYAPAALDHARVPESIATAELGDGPAHGTTAPLEALAAKRVEGGSWTCASLGPLAVRRSHTVAADLAHARAQLAAVAVAGQPPNPTVTLGVGYNQDRDPGDDSHFFGGPGFEYLWSPVGRGRIRAALADARAVAARTRVLSSAWRARHHACRSLLELAQARRRYDALERRAALLDEAVGIAREAAEAGLTPALTWQSLKLEANTLRLQRIEHFKAITIAGAGLAATLNLTPEGLGELVLEVEQVPDSLPDREALQTYMLAHHPAILERLADYDEAEHDLELAIAAQYPDINLSPGYFFDQGDHVWSLVGGIVVPLFASHDAAISAAEARRDAARAAFENVQAGLIADLQRAHAAYHAAVAARSASVVVRAELAQALADLRRDMAAGLSDGLVVKRAELQLAEIDGQLEDSSSSLVARLRDLEHAAAMPIDDADFRAQLDALYVARTDTGSDS